MMRRYCCYLSLLVLLLSACQGAPQATPPEQTFAPPRAPTAPAATQALPAPPTAAPAATALPTSAPAPTALPAAALLPAPLFFLDGGQIWRLERDGQSRRQLTFESSQVLDFDVGPADNALVYLLDSQGQHSIVLLDASGRAELVRGLVWGPRITPAGDLIAFEVQAPLDATPVAGTASLAPGVWTIARAGGQPRLLQASEPIPDPQNPPDDARQYSTIAWSPDGARLLMGVSFPIGEGGYLAVKNTTDSSLVEIQHACCEASWSPDGAAVIVAGGTLVQDALLGLWRADPRSGATTELLAPNEQDGSPLVTAARQLSDGAIYAFLTITKNPSIEAKDKVGPQRVQSDGTHAPLRDERYLLSDALWAADASGVVVADAGAEPFDASGQLLWLPLGGGAPARLAGRGSALRWATSAPQPQAGACERYKPIAWAPPASRTAHPEVLDVQRRLLAQGYAQVGTADGYYGDQTRAAVRAFQQTHGLPSSGDVDCATWAALLTG